MGHAERIFHKRLLGNQVVAGSLVGRRDIADREHGAPAIVLPDLEQERREVGIPRQDNELADLGGLKQHLEHIHNKMNIRAGLATHRERRAVDNFERRADEVRPVVRKGLRIEIAAPDQDAAMQPLHRRLERRKLLLKPGEPALRIGGELMRDLRFLVLEGDKDVIKVNKERRVDLPRREVDVWHAETPVSCIAGCRRDAQPMAPPAIIAYGVYV